MPSHHILKNPNVINYKVTKRGKDRHRVLITIEKRIYEYKDPYNSQAGIRAYFKDIKRDYYMTDIQIQELDHKLSGRI